MFQHVTNILNCPSYLQHSPAFEMKLGEIPAFYTVKVFDLQRFLINIDCVILIIVVVKLTLISVLVFQRK